MKKNILLIICLSFMNVSGAEDTSKEVKTGNTRGFLSDTLDDWNIAEACLQKLINSGKV